MWNESICVVYNKKKTDMDMKKICKNCARWYGTPELSYLVARSYSADCGKTDPNYSCKAFTKRKR